MDDEQSNRLERYLLFLEHPMMLLRKVCMMSFAVRARFIDFGSFYVFAYSSSAISQLTVPIPCEGS